MQSFRGWARNGSASGVMAGYKLLFLEESVSDRKEKKAIGVE